jgi:hypothetical protein
MTLVFMPLVAAMIAERISVRAGLWLLPPKYTRGADLLAVVGFYALAKGLETCDRPVFASGHTVSGHTLKHLCAAMAGFWILRMLQKREQIVGPPNPA